MHSETYPESEHVVIYPVFFAGNHSSNFMMNCGCINSVRFRNALSFQIIFIREKKPLVYSSVNLLALTVGRYLGFLSERFGWHLKNNLPYFLTSSTDVGHDGYLIGRSSKIGIRRPINYGPNVNNIAGFS